MSQAQQQAADALAADYNGGGLLEGAPRVDPATARLAYAESPELQYAVMSGDHIVCLFGVGRVRFVGCQSTDTALQGRPMVLTAEQPDDVMRVMTLVPDKIRGVTFGNSAGTEVTVEPRNSIASAPVRGQPQYVTLADAVGDTVARLPLP